MTEPKPVVTGQLSKALNCAQKLQSVNVKDSSVLCSFKSQDRCEMEQLTPLCSGEGPTGKDILPQQPPALLSPHPAPSAHHKAWGHQIIQFYPCYKPEQGQVNDSIVGFFITTHPRKFANVFICISGRLPQTTNT